MTTGRPRASRTRSVHEPDDAFVAAVVREHRPDQQVAVSLRAGRRGGFEERVAIAATPACRWASPRPTSTSVRRGSDEAPPRGADRVPPRTTGRCRRERTARGRAHRPGSRSGSPSRGRRRPPRATPRQVVGAGVGVVGTELLEGLGDADVPPVLPGGTELLAEALVHDRVGEAEIRRGARLTRRRAPRFRLLRGPRARRPPVARPRP